MGGVARGLGVWGRSGVGLWRSCSTMASSIESQSGYSSWGERMEEGPFCIGGSFCTRRGGGGGGEGSF